MTNAQVHIYRVEEHVVSEAPFYVPQGDEVAVFSAAFGRRIPVLLKGPTGTGKTRFVEYMAWTLSQPLTKVGAPPQPGDKTSRPSRPLPMTTVSCHEDLFHAPVSSARALP